MIVGHARSIRYNAGDWTTVKYGDDLKEREKKMIEDCDSAVIIWVDRSSVIAANLERLRKLGKPTFVYEYSTKDNNEKYGPLEPTRNYMHQRRIQLRSKADLKKLNKLIKAFLASGRKEQQVECENPRLTGYYLNKVILGRNMEDVLNVKIINGNCYLKHR